MAFAAAPGFTRWAVQQGVCGRGPLADQKGTVPPEQGPVGGGRWSEEVYFQG